MAEVKVSELPVVTSLATTDRLVVLVNPSTSANVRTITTSNFVASKIANTAPTSNTSNGVTGQIAFDTTAVYVCVANNTWGRASLTLSW